MNEDAGRPASTADGIASSCALAMTGAGPLDPRAVAVLEKQARVLDLQIDSTVRHESCAISRCA